MRKKSLVLALGVAMALVSTVTRSENLLEVYQAAAKSDPKILEAEARRMAALEVKPQARGALLPQISAAGNLATRNSESNSNFPQAVDVDSDPGTPPEVVIVNNKQESDSDLWNISGELRQTVFNWAQWQTLKRAGS